MPKGIEKADWDTIHQLACDIANAAMIDSDDLGETRRKELLAQLQLLRTKYGEHPSLVATTADYIDDDCERLRLYRIALATATEMGDTHEVQVIKESIHQIETNS